MLDRYALTVSETFRLAGRWVTFVQIFAKYVADAIKCFFRWILHKRWENSSDLSVRNTEFIHRGYITKY